MYFYHDEITEFARMETERTRMGTERTRMSTEEEPQCATRVITQREYDELLNYYYNDIKNIPMYPQFVRDLDIEVVPMQTVFITAEEYYRRAISHGYPTLAELEVSGRYQYWNYYVQLHEQYGIPKFEIEQRLEVV